MKEFWDNRYSSAEYAYGKQPNAFFKKWVDKLDPGIMFLPGEGEGRNAVYAASCGWKVTAFDQSNVARDKAMRLAEEKEVFLDYRIGSVLDISMENGSCDMIGLIYFHILPEARKRYHEYLRSLLKLNGLIVMECFNKEQIRNNTGGPKDIDMLYSENELLEDFAGLEVIYSSEERIIFDEGPFHQGEADVFRFVGRKIKG